MAEVKLTADNYYAEQHGPGSFPGTRPEMAKAVSRPHEEKASQLVDHLLSEYELTEVIDILLTSQSILSDRIQSDMKDAEKKSARLQDAYSQLKG